MGGSGIKSLPDRAKAAAEAFLVEVESQKLRGTYLDPQAGRITFGEYAKDWLEHQTLDESTREVTERRLRRHILPYPGGRELASIKPTLVRELDRKLQAAGLSTSLRAVVFANVSMVLNAAVDDERIAKNPCHARSTAQGGHFQGHPVDPREGSRRTSGDGRALRRVG